VLEVQRTIVFIVFMTL